ncbi:MAG: hypothetical protein KDC70_01205 [Saprospiraceae bacterium]|nr:hypothetical protein [Saprospiraceae bacterium]
MQEPSIQIFDAFKRACPCSGELYNPAPENVRRWLYHIATQNARKQYPKIHFDPEPLSKIQNARRVVTFSGFPEVTKNLYLHVGACYAGEQVFACGSRVRGDYVDASDGREIREARQAAGKAPKVFSDFDFFTGPYAVQQGPLPFGAERVRCKVKSDKILIPMWDFSKLPKSEHGNVRALFDANDLVGLVGIHDKYGLSTNTYCCNLLPVKYWFFYAINNEFEATKSAENVAIHDG